MNKSIEFSIIMSAYNVEEYIERAVSSVLKQDFKKYELIIVNDGSTDNTWCKMKEIKKNNKDIDITLINNKYNKGLGKSRNIAMKKAKGDYILYLDCDDTICDNNTLSKVNQIVEKEQPDLIYLGVQYVGGGNKLYIPTKENSTKEARLACDMHFAVSSKCFKREFLIKNSITFLENMYYEDMVYSIKCTILAEKLSYGEFAFYNYYRNREGSIMSTPNIRRCVDMYRMLAHIMQLYEITPEEYKPYLLSFIENETNGVNSRLNCILDAIDKHAISPVMPKRNYELITKKENNNDKNHIN